MIEPKTHRRRQRGGRGGTHPRACRREGCKGYSTGRNGHCTSLCAAIDRELKAAQFVISAVNHGLGPKYWAALVAMSDAWTEVQRVAEEIRLGRRLTHDDLNLIRQGALSESRPSVSN